MSSTPALRRPISTRHAFALAFDLAIRRDILQSIVVPLILRGPWILALVLMPPFSDARPDQLFMACVALFGDFVMLLVITAMLRFRARSVFNTSASTRPAPALTCYAAGIARLPWLLVTEVVRNLSLVFAAFFLVIPAIFLGFRLSFATEAVVLNEPHMAGAFQRSFRLTERRFERWLEMMLMSVLLVGAALFVLAVSMATFGPSDLDPSRDLPPFWGALSGLLLVVVTTVIQYAWTFFYLRLIEVEHPMVEVGPAYALVRDQAGSGNGSPQELSLAKDQQSESAMDEGKG